MTASETTASVTRLGRSHRRVVFEDGTQAVELVLWATPVGDGDIGGTPGHISIIGNLSSGPALVLRPEHVRLLLETMLEVKV